MVQDADVHDAEATAAVDGRTARRVRNQDAVLDAVLELFAEDTLEPGAAEVAERSGVSLRSVYRYYEDREALIRSAIARNMEKLKPLFLIDGLGEGTIGSRVERMVTSRVHLYEETAPMVRASLRATPANRIIRDQLDRNLDDLRQQVEDMFAPELGRLDPPERREVAAALDVILTFSTLEHLRRTRGFSRAETVRITARAVTALLTKPIPT